MNNSIFVDQQAPDLRYIRIVAFAAVYDLEEIFAEVNVFGFECLLLNDFSIVCH